MGLLRPAISLSNHVINSQLSRGGGNKEVGAGRLGGVSHIFRQWRSLLVGSRVEIQRVMWRVSGLGCLCLTTVSVGAGLTRSCFGPACLAGWLLCDGWPVVGTLALGGAWADRWGAWQPAYCRPDQVQQYLVRKLRVGVILWLGHGAIWAWMERELCHNPTQSDPQAATDMTGPELGGGIVCLRTSQGQCTLHSWWSQVNKNITSHH